MKKKIKNFKNLAGLPIFEIFDFFFYLNFKVLQKMILRAQFLLHLQVLYSKMFVIFTGMLPYNFLKKNIGLKGGGGAKRRKKNTFGKKKKKKKKKLVFFFTFPIGMIVEKKHVKSGLIWTVTF